MKSLWIAVMLIACASDLTAQQRVPLPTRPTRDTITNRPRTQPRQPGDTTVRDTLQRDLVQWAPEDSVMQALLAREGYVVTRYQANKVTFDAADRRMNLRGDAALQREQAVLTGDSVTFNDATKTIVAYGDTVILRDPSQTGGDLIAEGELQYNIATRAGTVSSLSTSTEQNGQTWFVEGKNTGFRTDSAGTEARRVFYAHDGTVTSCDLSEPHYHFKSSDMKVVTKNILVARPAVLYIADIPVMWLPFIFQDMRSGRRSGILSPRIGLSDIVRNTPSYRRQVENLGYYFAISDYMDAIVSFDWRSGARGSDADPGWSRYNAEWQYRWLDRFLGGRMAASHENWDNGRTNTRLSWSHNQDFSLRSRVSANLNYVTSTELTQRQAFTASQALATISSQLNYQQGIGPFSLNVGGSRTQYPGRDQVQQSFPNVTLSTKPIDVAPWLVWSPGLSVSNSQSFNQDLVGGPLSQRYSPRADGTVDSTRVRRDSRVSTLNFSTPLRIFGFDWSNSISINDTENDFPRVFTVYPDVRDTSRKSDRVYSKDFRTTIDWSTGFALPPLLRGTWNVVPQVNIQNIDGSKPFMVRSVLSGGDYVRQGKRLAYGVSASPTFFAFFPGFGPISRIRHSISPSVTYSFAPSGKGVSDTFLAANNALRVGYLGDLTRNEVTVGLNQYFEAKLKSPTDSAPGAGRKVKLLEIDLSSLNYDFERAKRANGITTTSFSYGLRSELIPGFNFRSSYSLFEGNPVNDSAKFKPYRTSVDASFSIGKDRNPFALLQRVFGKAVPSTDTLADQRSRVEVGDPLPAVQSALIAGSAGSRNPFGISATQEWQAQLSFSSNRSRPVRGENVIDFDPLERCRVFLDPFEQQRCLLTAQQQRDSVPTTIEGARVTRFPPQTTMRGDFTFNLTPKWAVQWTTSYDFQRDEFADHTVTLQRDLHDWRAIFAFTQAPNGNFAFYFFISLKAEPDLKFDYNRRTYRPTF